MNVKRWYRNSNRVLVLVLALALGLSTALGAGAAYADDSSHTLTYTVTIHNLTDGQPLSPPVVATHDEAIRMFHVGDLASAELEAIAEDGNQGPMVALLAGSDKVTDVVDVGMPLTPNGQTVGSFTDAATVRITAKPTDRLSMATMLICTNDGFTGLDSVELPLVGSAVYFARGYDAGTEENTEQSEDIVDPCSLLGPVELEGDPNGNENEAVDTDPQQPIQHHPNITGVGDLSVSEHGWSDPVVKVTVTRVADDARLFTAPLSGAAEVPPVHTDATGQAHFVLTEDESALIFRLAVNDIDNVVQAHIHVGLPSENGPVVAFLYGPSDPTGPVDGLLSVGIVSEEDLLGPLAGNFAGFVDALRDGRLYANVHTTEYPAGEIRGQIGAADPGTHAHQSLLRMGGAGNILHLPDVSSN